MADEQSVTGVIPPSGEGEAGSNAQGTQTSTPAPVNWQNDPEYRRQQAERDRREAELARRTAEAEERAHQAHLATLDPDERRDAEIERERELRRRAEMRVNELDVQEAKTRVLNDLHTRTGVPLDILKDAESKAEAERIAKTYQTAQKAGMTERTDLDTRNAPGYLGSSGLSSSSKDGRIEQAIRNKDTKSLYAEYLRDD